MKTDHTTPPYHFAITEDVNSRTPLELDGKGITAYSFIPTRARVSDTGYDVRCAEPNGIELIPGYFFKMRLGFRMFAPEGWWLSLAPRSGTFMKLHIHALYGIIDELFENEMCFVGQYIPHSGKLISNSQNPRIAFGERIAQVMPVKRLDMPNPTDYVISNAEYDERCAQRGGARGQGGFGSSGTI